jgi:NTP pyrophosphatase (non-canonical NTP hydrolase)
MNTEKTLKWAKDKGILEKSSPLIQLSKSQEELTELRDEVVIHDTLMKVGWSRHDPLDLKIKMELGDLIITLQIAAEMLGTTLEECQDMAFKKISKRSGRMINGMFVKDPETQSDEL